MVLSVSIVYRAFPDGQRALAWLILLPSAQLQNYLVIPIHPPDMSDS